MQFLEQVTGVANPNISAWRRHTVGDLTSALGAGRAAGSRGCRAPGELDLAEQEVREFQLPPIPGANQTFPVQPPGSKPVPAHQPPRAQ